MRRNDDELAKMRRAGKVVAEMHEATRAAAKPGVTTADLEIGRIYPDLARIREVSAAIALAVAENAFARGLTRQARPDDLVAHVQAQMYQPDYVDYV